MPPRPARTYVRGPGSNSAASSQGSAKIDDSSSAPERAARLGALHHYTDAYELLRGVDPAEIARYRLACVEYVKLLVWRGDYRAASAFLARLRAIDLEGARWVEQEQEPHVRRALQRLGGG